MSDGLSRGALCISIDLELLWGVWDIITQSDIVSACTKEREICRALLAVFDRHDIPVTWAFVGRLVDDSPGFDGLRGSRTGWHAADIVDAVLGTRVRHDLGSHSYSHVYFDGIDANKAEQELDRSRTVHQRLGRRLVSFVFPRSKVNHLDVLARHGVEVFRSADRGFVKYVRRFVPPLSRAANLLDKAIPIPPTTVLPIRHAVGDRMLVELPSSMPLLSRNGLRGLVPRASMRRKLLSGLRRAAAHRRVFHLYFHPSNFYVEPEKQLGLLEDCLAEAARLRHRGELDVRTMAEFGARA